MMGATMFTVEERDRIRDRVLTMADDDQRVVAAAAIGSLAKGPGDQWSDLDLGFGIADGTPVDAVIADWTGFCIERGRLWQAQYWINEMRDHALALACRRRGLDTAYARGYHDLPEDVLARFENTLVRSIDGPELIRALARTTDELLREAGEVRGLASKVEGQLRQLV